MRVPPKNARGGGFTLIELSIVLVIIGLIVGGILVGQDLIKAAETRAQISQIEKYNQAVNTFKGKFGALPGDMTTASANQFGFATTDCTGTGVRNGDGLMQGLSTNIFIQAIGETGFFWQDISSPVAGALIEGKFTNGGAPAINCGGASPALSTAPGTAYLGDYLPAGKIGHDNFMYVYSNNGYNWYGLSAATSVNTSGQLYSNANIPVVHAYNIDKKIDNGLPTTGSVVTVYSNGAYAPGTLASASSAPNDSTTTCYNTTNNTYSISSLANYGANGNCALSFRFQ